MRKRRLKVFTITARIEDRHAGEKWAYPTLKEAKKALTKALDDEGFMVRSLAVTDATWMEVAL